MRDAPGALLCRIKILKTSFLPFYFFTFKGHPRWLNIPLGFFYLFTFFTFKGQPCWLNIPLGFFTFLLFYLFTFKDCSW